MRTAILQKLGIPLAMLIAACLYYLEVRHGHPRDQMLIKPVFILMAVLFAVNGAWDVRLCLRSGDGGGEGGARDWKGLQKIGCFFLLAVALVALMPVLGFTAGSMIFLHLAFRLLGMDNAAMLYGLPVSVSLVLYMLFNELFGVPLPTGFLGF